VIHRDMKPSNVLVRAHDGSATVMDFGIAKMTTSTRLTATGQTMGTVRYMSPEQVRGQEVDLRTDLYSLGATLYESLTGDTPFDGETHFEIMTKHLSEKPKKPSARGISLPSEVEEALMKSLQKRASDRFESAREMRRVFEAALKDGDVALSETQKMGRGQLSELASIDRAAATTEPRAATASDLADRLEPTPPRTKRRSSRLLWILLALLVLGGGGTAAALLFVKGAPPRADAQGPRELVFEAGGGATAAQGSAAYRASLDSLSAVVGATFKRVTLDRPVDKIVLVTQAEVCDPSRYGDIMTVPSPCDGLLASVSASQPRTLLVAADRGSLQHAMDEGVASALCLFQSFAIAAESGAPSKDEVTAYVCDLAKKQIDKYR
jgi:hypothetical protein